MKGIKMTYDFTKDISTKDFEIKIDPNSNYGYFEHKEVGDECGGGLWFVGDELTDYDGVYYLPVQVYQALCANFIVDKSFDPND